MRIRKSNEYEVNQLLHWSVFVTEEMSMGYMKSNFQITYNMVANVLSNGGYYLIAENEWGVMGWVLLGIDQNYYQNETVGFIYELFVFPPYRKKGIGHQLMKQALSQLKALGLNIVQLNVFSGNHAKKMYEKLGFQEVTSLMEKKI